MKTLKHYTAKYGAFFIQIFIEMFFILFNQLNYLSDLLGFGGIPFFSFLCTTELSKIKVNMEHNKLLMSLSSDEFFERLKECFAEAMFAPEPNEGVKVKKHYVYGLQGICDLFGCSTATAARIKRSGAIDSAVS